jgi:hypothetical protein
LSYKLALALLVVLVAMTHTSSALEVPSKLDPPVAEGIWLRPSRDWPAEPRIGFKDGIQIGIWPTPQGPRGVVRVYAPYVSPGVDYPKINFIAIEPIVGGHRGLSELERSDLDDRRGLRMWLSDRSDASDQPDVPWRPSRGKLSRVRVDGKWVQTLTVVLHVEKFDNGAHPLVVITFRADRPNEVGFKSYSAKLGAAMESCVLSSTMGNFSRCRLLWLTDEVVDARKVWPGHGGHDFFWTADFPSERMLVEPDGTKIVAVTPSEELLASAEIPHDFWKFPGKVATQYWRKYPGTANEHLRVRVNGRANYYGTGTVIPGGVAYENFEIIEDFKPGTEQWFGVTLKTPRQMGWK